MVFTKNCQQDVKEKQMTKWDGGKGSTQKPYDKDAFDKNFARIFSKPKRKDIKDKNTQEVKKCISKKN